MKRAMALVLAVTIASPACATVGSRASRSFAAPQTTSGRPDPALMAGYINQLPIGARVKVDLASGDEIRGTLMKRDGDPIVVQRRTRVPEPPMEIRLRDIVAMELEAQGDSGRTVAIAIAAGAGSALGVLLLLAAIFSD